MTTDTVGPDALLRALPENPDHYLHALDFINRRALIVRIKESVYRNASFLDDRALNPQTEGAWVPAGELLKRADSIVWEHAPNFIFHIGHCGSTLLSRFLGSWFHVAREPLPLLALSLIKRELDSPLCALAPANWQSLFDVVIRLLARTYHPGAIPLVKVTSVCGNLAEDALRWNAQSRLLLVYVSLETCLQTMLKSEANRENSRAFAPHWLADFHRLSGTTQPRLHELTDAQQVALNWLMAMHAFTMVVRAAPERTLLVDFDAFLGDMDAGLITIAEFLGKPANAGEITALTRGQAATAYAKQPLRTYNRQMRTQELAASQARHGIEIRAGLEWARRFVARTPALAELEQYLQ